MGTGLEQGRAGRRAARWVPAARGVAWAVQPHEAACRSRGAGMSSIAAGASSRTPPTMPSQPLCQGNAADRSLARGAEFGDELLIERREVVDRQDAGGIAWNHGYQVCRPSVRARGPGVSTAGVSVGTDWAARGSGGREQPRHLQQPDKDQPACSAPQLQSPRRAVDRAPCRLVPARLLLSRSCTSSGCRAGFPVNSGMTPGGATATRSYLAGGRASSVHEWGRCRKVRRGPGRPGLAELGAREQASPRRRRAEPGRPASLVARMSAGAATDRSPSGSRRPAPRYRGSSRGCARPGCRR